MTHIAHCLRQAMTDVPRDAALPHVAQHEMIRQIGLLEMVDRVIRKQAAAIYSDLLKVSRPTNAQLNTRPS
jgi:hypothetical protein